ncbi:MAG: sugar phosphate isomerase/epimerase [Candidatus Omnitrophica bacterium]|nr:sugar phosphate isomerase/epimerase [Candidatus Omnitrophota bacterium]
MFKNLPLWIFSPDIGLREKLRLAVLGEFEGIDIDIREAVELSEKYSPSYVKGMLDSFNLKAGAWELPFALDAEEKTYKAGMEELEKYGRIAAEIGASAAIAIAGAEVLEKDFRENSGFCRERLNSIAGILNGFGCRVAIDFVSEKSSAGCHFSLEQVLEMYNSVKSGKAGIIIDAYYWHLYGSSIERLKKTAGDSGVYARLCDTAADNAAGNKTGRGIYLPGETGVIDLPVFLTALAESGYKGPVSPMMPDRNILTLPSEMAVRLLGGSFKRVWKVFKEKEG